MLECNNAPVLAIWDDLVRVRGNGWETITLPHGARLRLARDMAGVRVHVDGLELPGVEPQLLLAITPGESRNRWGVNGGAGLRIGGRVAVIAEARAFYFGSYNLRLELDQSLPGVSDLFAGLPAIRFRPIVVNAQTGLSFRF